MRHTERIVKLEVKMDNVEKELASAQQEVRENHQEVKEEFDDVKEGQRQLETTINKLDASLSVHADQSKQRKLNRWKLLQYLLFPLLLALFIKITDVLFS